MSTNLIIRIDGDVFGVTSASEQERNGNGKRANIDCGKYPLVVFAVIQMKSRDGEEYGEILILFLLLLSDQVFKHLSYRSLI